MKSLITVCLFLLSMASRSQEVPFSTQQQLENLGDENLEDDALLQHLDFYKKHPINLNAATVEDLQPLRLLTDLQIANLIRHRNLFGKLLDIYELQAIAGFDVLTIQKIRPYIFVGAALTLKESFLSRLSGGDRYALFRVSRVLEKARGYDTSLRTYYLGDRNQLLFRYRYQYKNLLYYGIIADKDAGEQFLKSPQKLGFDFYSIHFFTKNLGRIKVLAIGDYTVNLGQGLTQWQSLGFGKSVDVMSIKRQSPVFLPYRSSGEFYFNRGAAVTIGFDKLEVSTFISYKNFSGNLATDSINRFTSFGTSGYYRTVLEIADRNKINDFSFGGNLSYIKKAFKAGINTVMHNFSVPLQKRNEPYNYFASSGKQTFNGSLDYSLTHKNAHFFGEVAFDKKMNRAVVQGAMISLDKRVDLSLLYRNLSKEYQSLFGNAFSENTLPSNEAGLYAGMLIRPKTGWQLAAYADFYGFRFLKYRVSAPTRGVDYLAQVSFTPDKRTEIYLRYRTETKPIDETATGNVIDFPVAKTKQNLRLHFSSQLNSVVSVKGRTEIVWYDKKGKNSQEGFLSYIEVAGQPLNKLKGNVRLQYFESGGYDSRIYVYESDVLYGFSIPAFFDKGFRYYLNLSFSPIPGLSFWAKISQTIFSNKSVISSGLDEIESNRKTEVKLQVKYEL